MDINRNSFLTKKWVITRMKAEHAKALKSLDRKLAELRKKMAAIHPKQKFERHALMQKINDILDERLRLMEQHDKSPE